MVGVAGATTGSGPVLTAGLAALVGGAISMALGEYVSVSSQRDSQRAMIEKEKTELGENLNRNLQSFRACTKPPPIQSGGEQQPGQQILSGGVEVGVRLSVGAAGAGGEVVGQAGGADFVGDVGQGVPPPVGFTRPP